MVSAIESSPRVCLRTYAAKGAISTRRSRWSPGRRWLGPKGPSGNGRERHPAGAGNDTSAGDWRRDGCGRIAASTRAADHVKVAVVLGFARVTWSKTQVSFLAFDIVEEPLNEQSKRTGAMPNPPARGVGSRLCCRPDSDKDRGGPDGSSRTGLEDGTSACGAGEVTVAVDLGLAGVA